MKVVLLLKYLSAIQHCTDIISFGYCSNEGYQTSFMSGTFLAEDSSYYFCMLEILLGKLSKPLFDQVSYPYLNVATLFLSSKYEFPIMHVFPSFAIDSP